MIVSRNFLLEFFPGLAEFSIEEISDALFRSGVEVERHERVPELSGLYYGIVRSCNKVPDSNKLNVCQVEVPVKNEVFQIVCAASNVRKGLKVLVSLPGAILQGGKVKIGKRSIFNIESHGMLCSYKDLYQSDLLGKSFDIDGLIELDGGWDISKEFDPGDLGLDDVIFDLSVPANRIDLNCVWGLAKELSKNLNVPNAVRDMGVLHYEKGNSWDLKKILLTNNFVCGDYRTNLNSYLFAAFNEVIFDKKDFQVKMKSEYFYRLYEDYVRGVGFREQNPNIFPRKFLNPVSVVNLDWEEIFSILGIPSSCRHDIIHRLSRFQFGFSPDGSVLFPPPWRTDIQSNRDFIEEVLRIINTDLIEECSPCSRFVSADNSYMLALESIRELLRNRNFFECTTFNLHKQTQGELSVTNPISNHHVSMRTHALGELMEVLEKNNKRKNYLRPVFEIVQIWNEGWKLNILVPEMDNSFPLNATRMENDLYDLRSLLKRVFYYLNHDIRFEEGTEGGFFSRNNLLDVYDSEDNRLGSMGFVEKNRLGVNVWGAVVNLRWNPPKRYCPPDFSEFPPSFKDVSIEVSGEDQKIGDIINSLKANNLKDVRLMEKYVDDKQKISYLLRCKFQSNEKTLSREDIDGSMNEVYECLKKLNLRIR